MTDIMTESRLRRIAPVFALAALMTTSGCGGGSASASTSTGSSASGASSGGAAASIISAAPAPAPTPSAITVNGSAQTPQSLDTLTTRSGHWRFSDLGAVGSESHAYLWRLDENPDFVRVMICRRVFTTEAGDTGAWNLVTVPVAISDRGHSYNWSLTVAPGACRVMQNMEPVAPHPEWLRDAVAAYRVPSYDRGRSWGLSTLPALALDPKRGAYDPTSLGPIPGSSDTPSAPGNFVGVTGAQGGEYDSSRGFLHNVDARVIDAALHNEDSAIASFMPEFTQYSWYSLAQPEGGEWSVANKTTVDPQIPMAGDKPYEYAVAGPRVRADIDSVIVPDTPQNWGRDESHLENTAFVHWILTEDPVAGMVVQRQLAFHLANYFEYQRPAGSMTSYMIQTQQERGLYNGLSALWKSRDVARRVTSTNGTVIWNSTRLDKMVADGIASIDTQMSATKNRDVSKVTDTLLAPIFIEPWNLTSGAQVNFAAISNFMLPQYGKEPLWLWTRDGNATVAGWFKSAARQIVVRALYIGGALGVDQAAGQRGSSLPVGPTVIDAFGYPAPAPTTFATDVDWANWIVAQPFAAQSRTSFKDASVHTAEQMYELLLFAKDANLGTPDLDAAISKMLADKSRTQTAEFRYPDIIMVKHLSSPPTH